MKPIYPLFISLNLAIAVAQDFEQGYEPTAPPAENDAAATTDVDEQAAEDAGTKPDIDETSDDSADESPTADITDVTTDETADEAEGESVVGEAVAPQDEPSDSQSEQTQAAAAEAEPELLEEQPAPPGPGMAVRVERIQGDHAAVDPAAVKLRAPFPAKLLAQVPQGWRIEKSSDAPAFNREVELSPGSKITMAVQPHVLIPEADGSTVFAISEPGYDPGLGYRQNATVGAIMSSSIRQLEDDSLRLGTAIDQLQQLLVSLPRPEPAPQDKPAPNRKR